MSIGLIEFFFKKFGPTKQHADDKAGGYTMALLQALPALLGLDSINKQLTEVIAPI